MSRFTFAFLAVLPTVLQAQSEHQGHAAGERLGEVRFETSCSAAASRHFLRGIAQLHSFGYGEAEASFTEATRSDSTCAIAFWGIAMSRVHQLWTPPSEDDLKVGASAVRRGRVLQARTPRERAYIEAIGSFYDSAPTANSNAPAPSGVESDRRVHDARMEAYERAMAELARKYPDDVEATILHALAIVATADAADTTFAKQKRAAAMLTPLVKRLPTHPGLAHYIIHANDNPRLAGVALDAARAYASIAPSSVHARHMPSHIFTRLGMWDESIASNRNAEEIAPGPHTGEYLVYAYLQRGREAEARRFSSTYASLPGGRLEIALIDARPAVELGQWAEAAKLRLRPATRGVTAATMRFARALGAARSGDTAAARVEVTELAALRDAHLRSSDSYLATEAEIQWSAASAWLQLATGDTTGALDGARRASDLEDNTEDKTNTAGRLLPARELYGEMLLLCGRAVDALRELERSLELNPNRRRGLYLAARSAERAGRREAATQHYSSLARVLQGADPGRSDSKAARDYLSRRER